MLDWSAATDGCQGGIGVTADDPICKKRDALQARLRTAGWCWGAPMEKSAVDNDWHRCGSYDTDNLSNAEADTQRGLSVLRESSGQSEAALALESNRWFVEKQRSKSPLLQAYENAVEPINQRIGVATVLAECGIRGPEWLQQRVAELVDQKRQPSIEEMRRRLSPSEAAYAERFEKIVVDSIVSFHLGHGSKADACREIAEMPFALNDAAFQ